MSNSRILLPRLMEIGGGSLSTLPELLNSLACHKPFLLCDRAMLELGIAGKIEESLAAAAYKFEFERDGFADIMPEPSDQSLLAAVKRINAGEYDSVIALGGGSAIDSAKAIAILAKYGGVMRDYKAPRELNQLGLPLIAIPTTAGTGSEATQFTIITDADSDEKMLCKGLGFMPQAAIIDYELTLSVPPRITADTGVDALTHAIEAYVSKKANAYSDQQALAAMELIAANLLPAYQQGNNHQAREAMMMGSHLAGVAFSNASVALVHGMSRPIGAHFHVPHGLSNAMLLPLVTEYSIPGAPERYADCARKIKAADIDDSDDLANQKLLRYLGELNQKLQVPNPKDYGINSEQYRALVETMAEQAMASGSPANNPKVPSVEEIVALYSRAYSY